MMARAILSLPPGQRIIHNTASFENISQEALIYMDLSQYLPALKVPIDGIFLGDLFGFILALPVALLFAFWISEVVVKNRMVVVLGVFIGALLGFIIILGLVGTLIFDQPLPNVSGTATFFSSLLLCSALGLVSGILLDLIVASRTRRDYRRQTLVHA